MKSYCIGKKNLILVGLIVFLLSMMGCGGGGGGGSDLPDGSGDSGSDVTGDGSALTVPGGVTYTVDGNYTSDLFLSGADVAPPADEMNNFITCFQAATPPGPNATDADYQNYMDLMMACFGELTNMPTSSFTIRIEFVGTSTDETITIPAGSVFTPGSSDYQPMLIVQDIQFTVPANTTVSELLPVYCMAPDLDAPDSGVIYSYSGLTSSSCLLQIIEILDGKTLDFADVGTVQDAVWNCVEGDFGPADIAALLAL